MCVPSEVAGVSDTASESCALFVVKSVNTSSSGPKTTTDTGRSALRSARNARDAAMAFLIGAPFMLFDASMRSTAPLLEPPGGATARPVTGPPFSVTSTWEAVSGLVLPSATRYALSGNPEVGDSVSVGAAFCASAPGTTSTDSAAHATAIQTDSRRCAPALVERVKALAEHALRELDAALAELLEEDGADPVAFRPPVIVRSGATESDLQIAGALHAFDGIRRFTLPMKDSPAARALRR